MTPCHHPASQSRKGRCGFSICQSRTLFPEHSPWLGWTRVSGMARVLPQQRRSRLEIPFSLGWCGEQSGFLRCPERGGLPARLRQHRAGWSRAARARASMAQRWLGQGGSYMPPVSPSLNGDSLSSWHSEPQCWHRHLLLLFLPGRESRAAGRPPVSCGPAPRAGAGGAGGLCSAAKGPQTGSVRKANPCQHAWLVDTCMAPCARCATRLSPRPRVLWKSPGLGAVPLLIHFEASQP